MKRIMVLAMAVLLASSAQAQSPQCGIYQSIAYKLAKGYGEFKFAQGVSTETTMMEFWVSPTTGTWSILMRTPSGYACLRAAGDGFELETIKPTKGERS